MLVYFVGFCARIFADYTLLFISIKKKIKIMTDKAQPRKVLK